MSVSDPVGSTMVAAGAPQLHSTHLHPHPFEQTPLTMTDIADPHKKERTPSPEKREDGRIIDDVDGEGRIQHTREAFLINESATFEPNRTRSHTAEGSNNNTTSNAAGCSGSGSPMMAKQYLLRNRQKSGLNPESDLQPTDQIDSIQPIPTSTNSSSSSSHPLDSSNQPNVLTHWSDIRSKLVGKQLIIFLDYDGTLTPIVSQPSAAIIDQTQRERLAQLANRYPVAIVTGRKLETIKNFLHRGPPLPGLSSLYFGGSHGFDIDCPSKTPDSERHSKTVAEEFLPHLTKLRDQLIGELKDVSGSMVEDNKFTISVHYRNVNSTSDLERLHSTVHRLMTPFQDAGLLRLTHGHKVHEIRANFDWDKGSAVNYLLNIIRQELSEKGQQQQQQRDIVPIYVGDDTTDEDAFQMLRSYETNGLYQQTLSIFVREDHKIRPSSAEYSLRSPKEVGDMLYQLSQL